MGTMRIGPNKALERSTNEFLALHPQDKGAEYPVLTDNAIDYRRKREVQVPSGTPDASLRRGIFTTVTNPVHRHLNACQGVAKPPRYHSTTWSDEGDDSWSETLQASFRSSVGESLDLVD